MLASSIYEKEKIHETTNFDRVKKTRNMNEAKQQLREAKCSYRLCLEALHYKNKNFQKILASVQRFFIGC